MSYTPATITATDYLPQRIRNDYQRRWAKREENRRNRWLPYLHCLDQVVTAHRSVSCDVIPLRRVSLRHSTEKWVLCALSYGVDGNNSADNSTHALMPASMAYELEFGIVTRAVLDLTDTNVAWRDYRTGREVSSHLPIIQRRHA